MNEQNKETTQHDEANHDLEAGMEELALAEMSTITGGCASCGNHGKKRPA